MKHNRTMTFIGAVLLACAQPFRMIRAANDEAVADEPEISLGNASGGEAVFELAQDGTFFVPYGSYPHRVGMQIFDRAAADAMVAAHNSVLSRVKRFVGMQSYPVYIGHPDMPGSKDTDKAAYGWIEGMTAENEGMRFGPVKYNEDGQALVSQAKFRFYSPYWAGPKVKGGMRPARLISMGLTNNPNIPVPALANEVEEEAEEDAGNEALIAMTAERDTALTDLAAANESVTSLTAERDTAVADLNAANETIETLTIERDAANEMVLLVRRSLIGGALSRAITAGRVLPAEKAALLAELEAIAAANELETALEAMEALPKKLKTQSATGDLGGAKVRVVAAHNDEDKARREERAVAVANELAAIPEGKPEHERKQIAHLRAAAKNPDLFSKSPGTAA